MIGYGDFCALVVARGTAAIFAKAGCSHLKSINKPTFNISLIFLVKPEVWVTDSLPIFGRRATGKLLETKLVHYLTKYEFFWLLLSCLFLLSYDTMLFSD
jgi:hypothetical protein